MIIKSFIRVDRRGTPGKKTAAEGSVTKPQSYMEIMVLLSIRPVASQVKKQLRFLAISTGVEIDPWLWSIFKRDSFVGKK